MRAFDFAAGGRRRGRSGCRSSLPGDHESLAAQCFRADSQHGERRRLTVIDAGQIVNARTARSQISGGVIMGIGNALLEDLRMEPTGRFAGANLASYLVPVNADIPAIDVGFVDHPDGLLSVLGGRGIGGVGIGGVAAAVASAVHNATGTRVRELPITLDKLLG